MLIKVLVVGCTVLAVAVISVIAIVVSTSKGSAWSEDVWRTIDAPGDPESGPKD